MGTYYIPRNVKGESRILYIFSVKSLITTLIGGAFGFLFFFIFSIAGLTTLGWIFVAIFAVIGFVVGAVKIPTLSGIPLTKKIRRRVYWSNNTPLYEIQEKQKNLCLYKGGEERWN